jgi:hypothetical protein
MIDISFNKPKVAFEILSWLIWDYTLYFVAWYMCTIPSHSLVWEFVFALQLIRCQYQGHDFWHGQWSFFFPKSLCGTMDIWFMATMGVSKRWWIDTEHGPHHKHVNDFPMDPDNFAERLRMPYTPLIILIFPAMCARGIIHSIQYRSLNDLVGTMTFNALLYGTLELRSHCWICVFYILTFGLTQWFHHPKRYIDTGDPRTNQLVNSRDVVPHNFVIWYWMGGHDYQIEHHLYPTLSRYVLSDIAYQVKKSNEDSYNEITVWECLKEIMYFIACT